MDENRCKSTKTDGMPCRARRLQGSDYCFFHDPAKAADRAAARKAGGRHGRAAVLPPDTPHCPVKTAADVIGLLGETINHVRTGTLDPRIGNCIGYLSGIILKAVEHGEVEQRLAALEATVNSHRPPEALFDADPADLLTDGERPVEYAEIGS